MDMDMDVPISALSTSEPPERVRTSTENLPTVRARTLGHDRQREAVIAREMGGPTTGSDRGIQIRDVLPHPPLMTYVPLKVEGIDEALDIYNSTEPEKATEIVFTAGRQVQWLDYLPSPVLAATAAPQFCAVALLDCSVNVYSPTGRR
jgi:protein HIRA/HIR1